MEERKVVMIMSVMDLFTIIRIPAVCFSLVGVRGKRCYYKFRVLSFFAFCVIWVLVFIILSW